jgi:hypothetical protein
LKSIITLKTKLNWLNCEIKIKMVRKLCSLLKKLENKTHTDRIFLSIYCGELYWQNFSFLYLSINIDGIFSSVTDKVTEGIILLVILSLIFNLWPDDQSSYPLSHFSFFIVYFFMQQIVTPSISTQFNLLQQTGHHNTQFVSINILIKILLRILHFK